MPCHGSRGEERGGVSDLTQRAAPRSLVRDRGTSFREQFKGGLPFSEETTRKKVNFQGRVDKEVLGSKPLGVPQKKSSNEMLDFVSSEEGE